MSRVFEVVLGPAEVVLGTPRIEVPGVDCADCASRSVRGRGGMFMRRDPELSAAGRAGKVVVRASSFALSVEVWLFLSGIAVFVGGGFCLTSGGVNDLMSF